MAGASGLSRAAVRLLLAGLAAGAAGRALGVEELRLAGGVLSLAGAAVGGAGLALSAARLARGGQSCLLGTYASIAAWALTPWGLAVQAGQLAGEAALRLRRAGRDAGEAVLEHTPFRGCWLVARGGPTRGESHSWGLLTQRYAYDLLRAEDAGRIERPCWYRRLEDWETYGSPVAAAARGVVEAARDGVPDNEPVGRVRLSTTSLEGNYVLIRHPGGYYTLYAHLRRGSVAVGPGDEVRAGDVVGEAGNSGMSTAPHLHFQAMAGPSLLSSPSIPVKIPYKTPQGGARLAAPRRGEIICQPSAGGGQTPNPKF